MSILAPSRRWFRFSLRTLFVLMTLAAIAMGWLVWQLQIVQDRKATFQEIVRVDLGEFEYWGLEEAESRRRVNFELGGGQWEHIRVSWVRRLLGDESYAKMILPRSLDTQTIERAENAFPEAELFIWVADDVPYQFRDSLYSPPPRRQNVGHVFKTGLKAQASHIDR